MQIQTKIKYRKKSNNNANKKYRQKCNPKLQTKHKT